jgi:hypothetical protein
VVLIGSRARAAGHAHAADKYSDWDFHICTTSPHIFSKPDWLEEVGLKPITYVERGGRLGSTRKVTAIFAEGEADWVILPAREFRSLVEPTMNSFTSAPVSVQNAVTDLATVLQGGYHILKGNEEFEDFYHLVASSIPTARLSDTAACKLADGFVCDYVSTIRKINRGELLAARRWVHHQLFEANFRLLHEARLRAGLASLPDARRLELLGEPRTAELNVDTLLTPPSLAEASNQAAETCRSLMKALVGDRWHWPDLSALDLNHYESPRSIEARKDARGGGDI